MRLLLVALVSVSLLACGGETIPVTPADAGSPDDAGSFADAAVPDAAVTDAAVPAVDAGATDAAAGLDASAPADASVGADAGAAPDAEAPNGPFKLRVLAGNLTSGGAQSYDPGHGVRIFQGLKPDLALIQEFNYGNNSDSAIRGFVDTAFGKDFTYFRESGLDPKIPNQIPNGIISRYPIAESGSWDDPASITRDIAWARIDLPGPRDLWALSLHLRTSDATDRNTGATEAVKHLKQVMKAGDYLVIGGDFNTGSRTEACIKTFSELVITASPWPADQSGNGLTSAKRSQPLDWLLHNSAIAPFMVPVVLGANSFPNGLVFDSRVYTPLSDVAPVQAGDSGASNMQHMALVKDFSFP